MANLIPGYRGPEAAIDVSPLPQGVGGGSLRQVGGALLSVASRMDRNQRLVSRRAATRLGAKAGASGSFSMADESTAEGRAFNDAAMQAYGVQNDLYVRQRLFDLKTQYASDLSSFDARAKSAIDTMTAEMRKVAPSMVAERQQRWAFLALQYRGQIAETAARQQSARQKADILALTRQTHLEMDERAKDFLSGDPNRATQAFLSAMQNWSEISAHYDQMGADGLPLFSPAEKEKARIAFFDRFYASGLMAWVDANPDKTKAYADLRDGKVRAKIKAIDSKTGKPTEQIAAMDPKRELPRETYDKVLKYAHTRMTDDVAMRNRLEKENKKQKLAAVLAEQIESALQGDAVLDPRDQNHKKAAWDYYATVEQNPGFRNATPMDRNIATETIARRLGILPEQAASAIRAGMRGSPESQVAAADMIERLDAMPGDMLKGVGDEYVLAKGRLITAMTRAGLAPEEAVARATELTDPNKRERTKARRDAFKDKDFDKITVNEVEDMFDPGWLPWQRDPDTPSAAEAQLLADANGLFEREYLLTGDKDLSKKYALKKIKNTWDVSRINGKRQLMKYPPESFYGIGGGDAWMRSDLVDAVTDMGMWDLTEPIEKRLVVESDLRTARGETIVAPDGSHRVAHTYPILIRNDDGAFEPVVDKNGKPKRWWPDASKVRAKRTRDLLEKAMIARKMTFLGGKDILRGGF